jgi:glycosyltransferase involved in cell wall biosynthesis
MLNRPLRILQVSTTDVNGGAEKIAWDLFQTYRSRGLESWLVVGRKHSDDPEIFPIPIASDHGSWSKLWQNLAKPSRSIDQKHTCLICRLRSAVFRTLAHPSHELSCRLGLEDFDHPGSKRLLDLVPSMPDIVHCHNLHGGYFDLRVIPWLSRRAPLLLTLHDAWLLSGHCAHSFECERWMIGCGQCPNLSIYPAISRDATSYNWRRKRRIFSRSHVFVSTPSQWLMNKVEQSMLRPAIKEARVIPNGVDLSVFHPADRASARASLDLPQDATVLLFAANRGRANVFKDYTTIRASLTKIAPTTRRPLLFLCLGGETCVERIGDAELRFIPYQSDAKIIAHYYQAADLYVHASHADTFPCSVLEALACGTPVVATAVGGIPEQIKGLRGLNLDAVESNCCSISEATGVGIPAEDSEAMAESIRRIVGNDPLRWRMVRNAAKDARERFDLDLQAKRYLEWYEELLGASRQTLLRPAAAL